MSATTIPLCEAPRPRAETWPAALIAVVLIASALTEAPAHLPFTPCIFRNLTGLPCPGCGMTRGFVAMGHGRIGDAWRANPLAPFAYVFACGYLVLFVLGRRFPALAERWRVSERVRWSIYAAVLLAVLASWSITLARCFAGGSPD